MRHHSLVVSARNAQGSRPAQFTSIGRIELTVLGCAAVLLVAGVVGLHAQAYRVKDINPGIGDGVNIWGQTIYGCCLAEEVAAVGDTLYFAANDGTHGLELWRTDGTDAGTVLVKDINSGSNDSFPDDLTRVGNVVFFRADDGIHGYELWKTDGTTAGTVLVKDINPGLASSLGHSLLDFNQDSSVAMSNFLFFIANDGVHGNQLWKSDGTAAGTLLVADMAPGLGGAEARYLRPIAGTLYFSANTDATTTGHGGLWKSDGTGAGTTLVKLFPGEGQPYYLIEFNGVLYFAANDGVTGDELWKSDGTTAGTVLVKDIVPGPVGSMGGNGSRTPLQSVNGQLFFGVWNPDGFWVSDGTEAGTRLVRDGVSPLMILAGLADRIFFAAGDPINGTELWKSDGTAAGTALLKDIAPGSSSGLNGLSAKSLTSANCALYFKANDNTSSGEELWTSDGSAAGTVLFQDINPFGYSTATPVARVGSLLYLEASDNIAGRELWALDVGTECHGLSFATPSSTAAEAGGVHAVAVRVTTPSGAATSGPISVSYATANGTAIEGEDYTAASGTLTFPAGSASGTTLPISVTILNDSLDENDETLLIKLSANVGGPLGTHTTHTLTIADDDPPLSFFSLPPCRIIDTRNPDGPLGGPALAAGTDRVFTLVGNCDVPAAAKAVAANLTVTGPTAGGHLRIYPAGNQLPLTAAINYSAGQTRGNNGVFTLDDTGRIAVRCAQGSGNTHLILDVAGYFQ